MFIRLNKTTELETYINNAFKLYRTSLLTLHSKQWKEEDISGASCIQYKIYQYHLAVYYTILIYSEVQQGINSDWEYYKDKYKIETITKSLACDGINLDAILNEFGLPIISSEGGIESLEIEQSFEIEPTILSSETEYNNVDIQSLLDNPSTCEVLVESKCSDNQIANNFILEITDEQEFLIL